MGAVLRLICVVQIDTAVDCSVNRMIFIVGILHILFSYVQLLRDLFISSIFFQFVDVLRVVITIICRYFIEIVISELV